MISLLAILESFFTEGIHDKGILKAIYMIGTPGAGKSEVVRRIFAMPNYNQSLSGLGFKVWNSDNMFVQQLKKAGKGTNFVKLYRDEPETTLAIRSKAKKIADTELGNWLSGRLGIVIDGTGKDYEKTKTVVTRLESLGYDVYGIFVNTSIQKAIERNNARDRRLPIEMVKQIYNQVQGNVGKVQQLIGSSKFFIIDNSKDVSRDELIDNEKQLQKTMMKIMDASVKNPIGNQWIKDNSK